jgi:protein TonB
MAKPLLSENPERTDLQFRHFGVMATPRQSRASLVGSIAINVLLAVIVIILGAAARRTVLDNRKREAVLVMPVEIKPMPPPKVVPPKFPTPKPLPTPDPKVVLREVKPIEVPRAQPVPVPMPAVTPAPPKQVVAAAAPKPTTVNLGRSASVPNHDAHPAPVSLGAQDNPIAPSNRPAVAAIDLGHTGLHGMPPGSGRGANAAAVSLGSGQPQGSLGGAGSHAVQGVKLGGVTDGTGNRPGNGLGSRPAQVALGRAPEQAASAVHLDHPPIRQGPQVIYKPAPVYTAEARTMHLEGRVAVRIKVSSVGQVSVQGVTSGLGHGLDESAVRAIQATRFRPALDNTGRPIDWEGVVNVTFQLAG